MSAAESQLTVISASVGDRQESSLSRTTLYCMYRSPSCRYSFALPGSGMYSDQLLWVPKTPSPHACCAWHVSRATGIHYPARVQTVGLGSGRNRGGCLRTPNALSRTRDRAGLSGEPPRPLLVTGYEKAPRALALRALRQLYGSGYSALDVWLPGRDGLRNFSRPGGLLPALRLSFLTARGRSVG